VFSGASGRPTGGQSHKFQFVLAEVGAGRYRAFQHLRLGVGYNQVAEQANASWSGAWSAYAYGGESRPMLLCEMLDWVTPLCIAMGMVAGSAACRKLAVFTSLCCCDKVVGAHVFQWLKAEVEQAESSTIA